MSQRIAHVTLLVPDYDAGLRFYVDTLGFDLLEDTRISPAKRWVRVSPPGGGVALLLAKAATSAQHAATGNQTGGRVSFFLETDDFAQDHKAMLDKGVHFLEPPRFEGYGVVAVFEDPFGNLWDLIEPVRNA